jgi:hypothetical protein
VPLLASFDSHDGEPGFDYGVVTVNDPLFPSESVTMKVPVPVVQGASVGEPLGTAIAVPVVTVIEFGADAGPVVNWMHAGRMVDVPVDTAYCPV